MGEVFSFIKNGMWDDPASSKAGSMYENLVPRLTQIGLHERLAPMFVWRFCYMTCAIVFWIVALALTILDFIRNDPAERYNSFLEQISNKYMPPDTFKPLVDYLVGYDYGVVALSFLSFLLFIAATWHARMSTCHATYYKSKWLVRFSWLIAFLPMFLIFLVFPVRLLVDWNSLVGGVCRLTIESALTIPGSQLAEGNKNKASA